MNWTCYRTFSKKKDLDKHSRLVPISLKLIFLKVTDFWSVKNRCYKIWTYYISMVRKINEEQLLQKKCVLKVSNFKVILKHICWTSYIYVYIFEVHECKCCLFESLWAIFIYWKVMKQVLYRVVLYHNVDSFEGYCNHICWETKFTVYLSI